MIGYIEFQGQCVNFDRQGIVQIITEEPLENVPKIEGIDVKEAVQGRGFPGSTPPSSIRSSVWEKCWRRWKKSRTDWFLNDLNQLVFYYGDH